MQIAISTGSLSQETPKALEKAAALGFRHVEVNLQTAEFDYGYRRKPDVRFYRQLRKQIDELGLVVWSVTAPPLTQEQMFSTRARKDILISGIGAAGLLGSQVYVTGPTDLFQNEDALLAYLNEPDAPPVIQGFDEAWAQVVNRRMVLAIRNYDYWMGAPLINQAERMQKLTDDLAVGCALDIRLAQHRNPLPAWIDCISDRLAVAYVYDLGEDGRPTTPAGDEWAGWLIPFRKTRLKCLVISAGQGRSDVEIIEGRTMIEEILSSA
jgi:sugar phosphate isomerase/epimerase